MIALRSPRCWFLGILLLLSVGNLLRFEVQAADEVSEEETTQIKAAERFLTVLEKNPRRGTALDRVYGHHVEFGSLDKFVAGLKEKTAADSKDGTSWMLLGLIESQRGQDGNAVDAFKLAETNRPTDALASYYLAQSLLRIGQNEDAVATFERAIERKPQRNDLLEIFQQLGRVHQRAQRTEEALKVWTRLEALFPDDPRVLEQIAVTLAEEGNNAAALERYERLTKLVKDDYRRTMSQIEVAELKIKSGQKDGGIGDLENVMKELDPDSWIYKDVRRRIDDVFLRSGDQDSLVKYYQTWIDTHPEDVEGMARLAKFLAQSARVPEATLWMEKALKLAPSRTDLRKTFIDQLVDDQRIPEAVKQYEQLAIAAPGNPDFLREWGKLVLKDKSQDLELRKKEAVRIWNQIVANRPDDAITTAQVADLFRQVNMNEEAQALYEKAVVLAPADPQYREYLGEFYHIQKKTDEALKTWSAMAEGKQHTAENVARLAEVYNSFGYLNQAVKEIADACKLAPKEFMLQMRSAEYHARATKYDDALTFLDAAEKLAASDDDRDSLIRQRIEVFQSSQRLDDETKKLAEAVSGNAKATPSDWALLARYYEANRQWIEATESIEKGLAIDPKSAPTLTAAARISESSGNYGQAADYSRRLAESDRRSRGDHLMNVARLEAQMGRSEQALAAANELIVSAPGNTDNYEFLAQMCFRLGKSDEGLEALRKAVRINPNEPHLIMALASALADQLRTDEAIEVYWRAFDKSETIEDKTNLTQKLVPLYEQINQFDKLIERFERDRREEEKRREMTICLAQAWQTSGDFGTARQELEQLLGEDSRDTNLLQQLAKLCETSGDVDAAIGYQRQLIAVAPGHETEFPLVAMLQSRGDRDAATEILVRLTAREEDPVRLLRSIDSLLNQGAYEAVISVTEPLLSQQREDWELLYREGVAWAKLEKIDESKTRFDRILALTLPHDTLGLVATDEFKRAQAKAKSENLKGNKTQAPTKQSPLQLLYNSSQVQSATGLISEDYYSGNTRPQIWTPRQYGVARMAAFAWKLKFEEDAKKTAVVDAGAAAAPVEDADTVAAQVAAKAQADRTNLNAVYDWLYVSQLKGEHSVIFDIARELARTGGKEQQEFFLTSVSGRHITSTPNRYDDSANAAGKTPLSEDDLALMMKCIDDLTKQASENNNETASIGSQIAYDSEGNAYMLVGNRYVRIGGGMAGGKRFTMQIVEELKLAKRDAEAEAKLNELYASAKTAAELSGVISVLLQQEKQDKIPDFFQRWVVAAKDELAKPEPATPTNTTTAKRTSSPVQQAMTSLIQWIGRLGPEEENAQILSIFDQTLDIAAIEYRQRKIALAAAAMKSRRPASAASSRQTQTQMNWYYGKESNYVQVELPSSFVDMNLARLHREVHEVLKRNDVVGDLASKLKERANAAAPQDADFANANLATELWWSDEKDEAVEILVKLGESQKDNPNARFEIAELRTQQGDLEDALEIVDSIIARDQKLLQRRELMALTLAERLGDHERARTAAERLFGLRLDSATQLSLVAGMRRLGMAAMADAVIARTERQSSNQPASLASLMMLYQSQGKTDRAKQLAHILLRKTVSPMTTMANATRNPTRYRTADDGTRTHALTVLQQTGELKTLIAQLESQLARSPGSSKLFEQLIEFYGVTGEKDKVGPMLEQAIAARPEAFALRLQLAKHWQQAGKTSEACDQYLALMKLKPDWIFEDFYQIRNLFKSAKRNADIVTALKSMNLRNISQPYYVVDFVGDLLSDEANAEVALELVDKVVDAFPSYRMNLISNVRNPKLWQSERFFALGKKMVLPTEADLKANPWSGLKVYSYSGGGDVNSQLQYLLRGLDKSPRLDELRTLIEETSTRNPGWYAGSAILALIEMQQGKKEEARARLEQLLAREEVSKSLPYDAGWLIAQELDKFEGTRALAMSLYEKAMANNSSQNEFEYSPGPKLIKSYIANGRRDDAKALLVKSMQNMRQSSSQPDYAAYQRASSSLSAANHFLEMKLAIDAVRIYQDMLSNEADLKLAGTWNGEEDRYLTQAKSGLAKAMASLDSSQAAEAIEQLLTVAAMTDYASSVTKPALDLMMRVPSSIAAPGKAKETIDSALVRLLVTLAKDEKVRQAIDARLESLQKENPQDLSIAIALAAFRGQMKDERFAESVKTLVTIVAEQPLEEVAEGRRPNSRQRKAAAFSVPLWIVAREALNDEAMRPSARILADRALEGAKRQTGLQQSATILLDWSSLLLEAGDKSAAEEKLTELLRISTERPTRKKTDAGKAVGAIPMSGPVLTADEYEVGRNKVAGHAGTAQTRIILDGTLSPDSGFHRRTPLRHSRGLLGPAYGVALYVAHFKQLPVASAIPLIGFVQPPPTDTVPPLTISQFRLAMTVADTAAKNGMAKLSRDAVKEAMLGGSPVPDPSATPTPNSRVVRSSRSIPTDPAGQFDAEVVSSLQSIIAQWDGEVYPASDVYALLRPLVFPASRPADILLFPDNTKLRAAKTKSLGLTLVDWAKKADQIADLTTQIDQRKTNPTAAVPALVLLTQIDLAVNNDTAAAGHLKALLDAMQKAPNPATYQLACHAALPAASKKELEAVAYSILKSAVQMPWTSPDPNNGNQLGTVTGKLDEMVNRYLAKVGDIDGVQKYFDAQQVASQADAARYGGDYGLYKQWNDLGRFATEAARNNIPSIAGDYLGRVADFDAKQYSPPDVAFPLALMVAEYAKLAPKERYEAWRNWTMPTENRRTVRCLAYWIPGTSIPNGFVATDVPVKQSHLDSTLCNLTELISAARESGTLEELSQLALKAKDEKLPNADFLWMLTQAETANRETFEPLFQQFFDSMVERRKDRNNRTAFPDFLVAQKCLRSDSLSDIALSYGKQRLRKAFEDTNGSDFVAHIETEFADRLAKNLGSQLGSRVQTQLANWVPQAVGTRSATSPDELWLGHDNLISHYSGGYRDALYLKWPMTGNFEFHVDCMEKHWGECDAGYGGVIVTSNNWGSSASVFNFTGHDQIERPNGMKRGILSFNHITVQSRDGMMRYLNNGRLVYEEKLTGTVPWIVLETEGSKMSVFRNPRLTGSPTIPREVALIDEDSMPGWSAGGVGGTTPSPRIMAEKVVDQNSSAYYSQRDAAREPYWSVKSGVMTGRANSESDADAQSSLNFCRPLLDGETLSYEFYREGDHVVAHPVIGRLAFMIQPDGVKSHWITSGVFDADFYKIPNDNSIVESDCQRGPKTLPLKNGDWNLISMSRRENAVEITLNGELVFLRSLSEMADFRPGFFRYFTQEARIRNVKLSGDWPENSDAAELNSHLMDLTQPLTANDRLLINSMMPALIDELQVPDVLAKAKDLPPADGFTMLKSWVLPNDEHNSIRLAWRSTPILPEADAAILTPSDLQSPALELIRLAKELNQVDQLLKDVETLPVGDDLNKRNRQALIALLAMQGNAAEATQKALSDVFTTFVAGLPLALPPQQRAAELLVIWEAMQHPETLLWATEAATKLRDNERDEKLRSNDDAFHKLTHTLIGRLDLVSRKALAAGDVTAATVAFPKQWTAVPYVKPEHRYRGHYASHWSFNKGEVKHHPAGTWSQLFFQSPLRGKFEILVDRSTYGYKEVAVSYGMHAAEPRYDLKAVKVARLMHTSNDLEKVVTLPAWNAMADFRIVVDDRKITTFTNGVQIHEEIMDAAPSPWIVLQTHGATDEATIRNLRIVGTPEIPVQIDLIDMAGWACWRADNYGEWHNTTANDETTPWQKVGDEIIGKLKINVAGPTESLLLYQRPMLEDGEIEFETFYVPGEQEVSPAVGKSAILLQPDGAKLHTLTEAQYDPRDLAVDNATPIDGAAEKIELKPNDWNKIKLTLKGDQLTVAVNGTDVATHTVTSRHNERYFGLFRFSNKTACRVRKLVYRGDWPRLLPAIADQELALPEGAIPRDQSDAGTGSNR